MNDQLNAEQKKVQKRSRTSIVILLLVFIAPWLFALFFYMNPQFQPGPKNKGILYKPVINLNKFNFVSVEGNPFTLEELLGKWTLIYIGGAECAAMCQETLLKARNGIIAQGKEGTRVRYIYISLEQRFAQLESLKNKYAGLILLTAANEAGLDSLSMFRAGNDGQVGKDDRLYLVDPAGNLLMHYPAGFKDLGLMEDLKHLLKL
jgi:cytochrome oxidase Cu insertion factor (SCO1/SenC/PrrC family)